MTDFEVICVDDGSTDNSLEILVKTAEEDGRFIIITQENEGPGAARNLGISIARGDYVLFMDPDDWYPDDDTLKTHLSKTLKSNCAVSGGSLSFYDSKLGKIVPGKVSKAIFKDEKIVQ